MNKKEVAIISALRQNARKSLTLMSRETRIPISTLHEKIQSYKGNLIKKHTTIIDFSKIGYNARANVFLKVETAERQALQEYLCTCKNVNSLMKVNNGFDFMAELVFPNIKDMEDFMESIEQKFKITAKETYYIIDELKREEFMANPRMALLGIC